MHELSLCEQLKDIIEVEAQSQAFRRVICVQVEIGPLSCVEPEAMQFGFESVMRGTIADGAKLEIQRGAILGYCLSCNDHVELQARFDNCPVCGAAEVHASGGDTLRINQLEVI